MTLHYRTRGFVFKKDDRNESDRVFTVFTRDFGRLEVTGRAIRKIASKLRGGIDIFSLSEIEFIQGRAYKTLTDAVAIEKFDNITEDLEKLKIAGSAIEVLDILIKGQEKDEKIWNLIVDTFHKLNNQELNINCRQLLYYYFFWSFLSVLGYRPEVLNCAVCRNKLNPHSLYFSNKEGGVICRACSNSDKDAKKINSDIVKVLRIIFKNDWPTISKLKIESSLKDLLKEISDDYYLYILSNQSFKIDLK